MADETALDRASAEAALSGGTWPRCPDCGTRIGAAMTVLGPLLDRTARLRAERDEALAKLASVAAYIRDHQGDAGLSLLHAGDLLAITGTGETQERDEEKGPDHG